MHPMFVKLFLEADPDDQLAEEEQQQRRRANLAGRGRSRMTVRTQPALRKAA